MYNYSLLNNEKIIKIYDDVLLKTGNDILDVSVIITNMRFIILSIPKNKEVYRVGRMIIDKPISKETIFETEINNIIDIKKEEDYYKYILSDTNYFLLNTDKIYKLINQNK